MSVRQPPTELVFGAPLQLRERETEIVVGVRTAGGWQELKRFKNPPQNH